MTLQTTTEGRRWIMRVKTEEEKLEEVRELHNLLAGEVERLQREMRTLKSNLSELERQLKDRLDRLERRL